jgi:triphosphoribosyl-dephospho-CoA synthetase
LGGKGDIEIMVSTDSSYGTGPKGRSISGHLVRLHPKAGAVSAKSHASRYVRLSTFESELEGLTTAVKTLKRLINVITELKGTELAADKLTKLGSRKDHRIFMENIQGLRLLPKYEAYKVKSPHED